MCLRTGSRERGDGAIEGPLPRRPPCHVPNVCSSRSPSVRGACRAPSGVPVGKRYAGTCSRPGAVSPRTWRTRIDRHASQTSRCASRSQSQAAPRVPSSLWGSHDEAEGGGSSPVCMAVGARPRRRDRPRAMGFRERGFCANVGASAPRTVSRTLDTTRGRDERAARSRRPDPRRGAPRTAPVGGVPGPAAPPHGRAGRAGRGREGTVVGVAGTPNAGGRPHRAERSPPRRRIRGPHRFSSRRRYDSGFNARNGSSIVIERT